MTSFETRTILEPAEVIERARKFFALSGTQYTGYAEQTGDGFLQLRMEVGEIVIAATRDGGVTRVRGTASRGMHLVGRFMTLIGDPMDVRETTRRRGVSRIRAAKRGGDDGPGRDGAGQPGAEAIAA